jgi:hypothetical protein
MRATGYFWSWIAHCINQHDDPGVGFANAQRMSYLSGGFPSIAAAAAYSL